MTNGGEAEQERPDAVPAGGELPDHRQYARYVEQHFADSLDDAVRDVEAWAARVLAGVSAVDPVAYPSAPWFARQIHTDLAGTRRSIASGDAHKAAWYALRVGELITDARRHGYLNASPDAPPDPIPPPERRP